jgi:hypothetical protein
MSPRSRKRKRSEVEQEQELDEEAIQQRELLISDIASAFKDDFHEAIDQLPLVLQRQFSLIRELDEQSRDNYSQLVASVNDYISHRLALQDPNVDPPTGKPAHYGRELLTRIGCLSEEEIKAAEEKVNIAQNACDSVSTKLRQCSNTFSCSTPGPASDSSA